MGGNGWRYGLVKADHYRPIEERNIIQPLLTIPLVSVSFLSVGGAKIKQNEKINDYWNVFMDTYLDFLIHKFSKDNIK